MQSNSYAVHVFWAIRGISHPTKSFNQVTGLSIKTLHVNVALEQGKRAANLEFIKIRTSDRKM